MKTLRPGKFGSSSHPAPPIADVGKCITRGVGRRPFPPRPLYILPFRVPRHSSVSLRPRTSDLGLCFSSLATNHSPLSLSSGHQKPTPCSSDGSMSRWADFRSAFAPKYCAIVAFSANKPDRLLSISEQSVHFRVKAVFFAGHFVIVSFVFIYIAGSSFIFNIFMGLRPNKRSGQCPVVRG
jgi:hypothetical protein